MYAGMQIRYDKEHVFIHQQAYLHRVIRRFRMEDATPVATPADPHVHLMTPDIGETTNMPFRQLIGSLMYLAVVSRPDIAYAVSVLSQFMQRFNESHWTAALRVLRYLKGAPDLGIKFDGYSMSDEIDFEAFADSDVAGDAQTRRSRTGALVMLHGGPVWWSSHKQVQVTLSSAEAEFIAACSAVTTLKWYECMLLEMNVEQTKPELFIDNQAAIKPIRNPSHHMRTRHIDVKYKMVKEAYQQGSFFLSFTPSTEQLADVLKKALPPTAFRGIINTLMFKWKEM